VITLKRTFKDAAASIAAALLLAVALAPKASAYPADYSPGPLTYTVRAGDTLTDVARKTDRTVRQLVYINRIPDRHYIETGFVLRLWGARSATKAPAPPKSFYTSAGIGEQTAYKSDSGGVTTTTSYGSGYIQSLITSYDWEDSIALGVASCESHFNPYADNPTSSAYGVFQRLGETSSDPTVQVANAYAMWQDRYWQPWGWPDGAWGCYW
jgi:LysM domain